ncbi:MAG: hypothetical protein OEY49_02600 [Candidatus Heimdallarchaeota archaeon]|nr:hypothetical protein [Candidatus Heimdallarchaeota archaeon]
MRTIEIKDKKGLKNGKSHKKTTKYTIKVNTIHVGHIINIIQSSEIMSRNPVLIRK